MAVTVDQLLAELGAGNTEKVTARLTRVLAESGAYLLQYLQDSLEAEEIAALPAVIRDKAQLVIAMDLYHQAQAPNGVTNEQYDVGDGTTASTPVRIGRDPLRGARQVLEPWIGPVIA